MADRDLIQTVAVERPKHVAPPGWTRGELLAYSVNSQTCLVYRASAENSRDSIQFGSTLEANDFMGWWYAPLAVRMCEQIQEPVHPDVVRLSSVEMLGEWVPSEKPKPEEIQSITPAKTHNLLSDNDREDRTLHLRQKHGA
jgi:hypothetical protein